MCIELTPDIMRAAATDAGNASMRRNGRTRWNEDDFNAAAEKLTELYCLVHEETL